MGGGGIVMAGGGAAGGAALDGLGTTTTGGGATFRVWRSSSGLSVFAGASGGARRSFVLMAPDAAASAAGAAGCGVGGKGGCDPVSTFTVFGQ